ncbi:DNA/RNA non-specific endonuclease [Mucilaginibacter robiniae]|uniref:DNA/RNA non-specific endonuclease n=1 Tax=Mucilaginibacter robiniae TaxID=2728022 RepID=A0A7L5EAI6_9SPHI|nr:DNA/RNA non-specific endonuclease [Mucilaginibacter robiniae]QJD97396.1 DNA/RNA non-specific endonuclease [Mucilaginibacter robiniae]
MKLHQYFIYSFFALLLILNGCSCNRQSSSNQNNSSAYNSALAVSEDFEAGSKSSYAPQQINFKSGLWYLKDALIGNSAADAKNGNQSIRLRNNGELQMNFDVNGAGKVTIAHAAYGNSNSTWQLFMSIDGGRTFTQTGVNILSQPHDLQTITFVINHQGPIRFAIRKISGGKSRINIDDFKIYSFNGGSEAQTATASEQSASDTAQTGDNLLLGNPSNAVADTHNPDNYLITLPYYTESYNRSKSEPNWVSWYVSTASLGSVSRINNFRPNISLPKGWYEVQQFSYSSSGFERGHNCPSADRTSTTDANSATFLMTNMIPQAPNNNEKTWGNLENYERELVRQNNKIYIIMGSYGTGGTGSKGYRTTIDSGRVNVPSRIWKVIVVLPVGNNDLQRINNDTRVIAVDTPNDNSIVPDWTQYLCTVRDIEKATGYNLLSKLPKTVQDAIETHKDTQSNSSNRYNARL